MGLRMERKAMGIFLDLFKQKREVGKLRFRPQKGRLPGKRMGVLLQRSTPEKEGVSSLHLRDFLKAAQNHPTINPHSIAILRHGKMISQCTFAPYRWDVWHETHSMCKGITALAIGMLVDSGKLSLEERVADIFPGKLSPLGNPISFLRFKNITVRHLLTMSSGVEFSESGSVTTENWLKGFFESGVAFEPGSAFEYNSMNSYMLSAIVKERSGMGLVEFLRPRLFVPLGMGKLHWEKSPDGIEKGGWGLYLCPEDMAKIGIFMLQKGVWNGRRLISREFIEEMTRKQIDTPADMGEQGYGFQVWMGKRRGSYLFNGILGQNIVILPDLDMVIVTTGGNDCLFKTSTIISLIEDFFADQTFASVSLPGDSRALSQLRQFEEMARNQNGLFPPIEPSTPGDKLRAALPGFRERPRLPAACRLLDGKSYDILSKGARLLPLFTQLIQNNYTTGITRVSFEIREERFYLLVREGEEVNSIELSFGNDAAVSTVTVNQESYFVAANARFATDEDGNTVLKVLLPFLENASGRKLKFFFFRDGSIQLRMTEAPDPEALIRDTGLMENKMAVSLITRLVTRDDEDIFEYTVRRSVEPCARGRRTEESP